MVETESIGVAEESTQVLPRYDYIQEEILYWFYLLQNQPGDILILLVLGLCGYFLYKRRYRMSVAFLVLGIGIVLIRVVISLFFGDFHQIATT